MSDFLTRIAARAVGEDSATRPRLPGLFEPSRRGTDTGLEIVDDEIAGPARLPSLRAEMSLETMRASEAIGAAAPDAKVESHPADEPPARSHGADLTAADAGSPAAAGRSVVEVSVRPRAVASSPIDGRDDHEAGLVAPSPEPETPVPSGSTGSAITAQPVRGRPAAAHPVPNGIASSSAAANPAHEVPQPVRVHIGRLEVRADLQEAPPQQRRRENAPSAGLSLADYLRGKREAG